AREQTFHEQLVAPPIPGHRADATYRDRVPATISNRPTVLLGFYGHLPTPLLDRGRGNTVRLGQMFVKGRKWFYWQVWRSTCRYNRNSFFRPRGENRNHIVVVSLGEPSPSAAPSVAFTPSRPHQVSRFKIASPGADRQGMADARLGLLRSAPPLAPAGPFDSVPNASPQLTAVSDLTNVVIWELVMPDAGIVWHAP